MREPSDDSGVRRIGDAPSEPDEAALLERVRRGDADAFDVVARTHAPRLYRLALHLARRPEEAEDLVQETLVRALPKLDRFEGRARLSTYLMRALTNLWKNRLRARGRSRIDPWPEVGEDRRAAEFPDPAPSVEQGLVHRDRGDQVRDALERLEPTRRLAILLREVEGLSYEEIAGMTDVPVGTVRSRLARARDDLRRLLGGRP
jgi:RNA polymerase sigma-70 factor (ECF subfamily)